MKSSKEKPAPATVSERIWRVDSLIANAGSVAPQLTLYGTAESPRLVKVAAPASAIVQEMAVVEGQRVRSGDALFKLDERDFLPQIAQLEAQISQERNRHKANEELLIQEQRLLKIARENESRLETLLKKKLGSQAALDEARRNTRSQFLPLTQRQLEIDNHPSRLKSLRAQLTQLNTQLERSQLKAPFDAVVVSTNKSQGDMVRSGDVLVTFYAPENLEVRAQIPSSYEQNILKALSDGSELSAITSDGAKLVLDRISGQASTQGITALFKFRSVASIPLIGQQLTLQLSLPEQTNSVAVPASALYGNDRLFLLNEGRMKSVIVEKLGQVLINNRALMLVRSDSLTSGDEVITTHLPNAVNGLRVQSSNTEDGQEQ